MCVCVHAHINKQILVLRHEICLSWASWFMNIGLLGEYKRGFSIAWGFWLFRVQRLEILYWPKNFGAKRIKVESLQLWKLCCPHCDKIFEIHLLLLYHLLFATRQQSSPWLFLDWDLLRMKLRSWEEKNEKVAEQGAKLCLSKPNLCQ